MRNITVAVPDETYRKAKVRAAELDTSVSALVRGFLEDVAATESDFDRRRRLQESMDRNRAAVSVCGGCEVGPVGNEGPSYWSAFTYWNPEQPQLPEA